MEGCATASLGYPRVWSLERTTSNAAGKCQAPGTNTIVGFDMITSIC